MKPLHRYLPELERLLARELLCARTLDMAGLRQTLQERAALMACLPTPAAVELDEAARHMVDELRRRVRRLESLYRSARQTLVALGALHCRRSGLPAYGADGARCSGAPERSMLSGKV